MSSHLCVLIQGTLCDTTTIIGSAMYYEAFRSVLRFIAQLNEFTLFFNIWIVSPLAHREGRTRNSLAGSTLRSVGYAVSEPLYTLLLTRLPVDPAFSFFMATIVHGFQVYWLWIMLDCVAKHRLSHARERDQEAQSECESAPEKQLDAEGIHIAPTTDINGSVLYLFVAGFIQTASASNAALLLAEQDTEPTDSKCFTVHVILLVAGLFYFFLSRFADCYLARVVGLPLYLGQHRAREVVIPQMANQLLLTLLRGGVRWLAGMKAFAGAWGNDALGVEKYVGFARFSEWVGHAPKWLSPLLLVLSPCLMYVSGRSSAKLRTE